MFESFVGVLGETIEAVLIVGILLVVTNRSARRDLRRAIFRGTGLAIVASMIGGWVIPQLPIDEEAYEGGLFWASAVATAWLIWWIRGQAKTLDSDAQQGVHGREGLGLGALAFIMIFRTGPDVLTTFGAVNLTTDALLDFIGALLGVALAIAFGVMFVRRCHDANLRNFFKATTVLLGIFLVQLLLNGYHEFSEIGMVPATPETMGLLGPIVRNNSLFLLAILAVASFIVLIRGRETAPSVEGASAPERRLVEARIRRARFNRLGSAITAVVMMTVLGIAYGLESLPKEVPPPESVAREGDSVVIPLKTLEDGTLHRFGFLSGGRMVRFLVMKTQDGKVRTALDACEICGPFGYVQDGSNLLCLNCAAQINPMTLGAPGGCNPIPLESEIAEGRVTIPVSRLQRVESQFLEQPGLEAIDPVCGMKVRVDQATAFESYDGETYYFCNMEHCHRLFQANPAPYGR